MPLEQLELLLPPGEKGKFKWYRKQVLIGYRKHYSPSWAAVTFREEYGGYPPDDWRRHSIFGETPTDEQKSEYLEYLKCQAQKHGKSDDWIAMHIRFEFGRDA